MFDVGIAQPDHSSVLHRRSWPVAVRYALGRPGHGPVLCRLRGRGTSSPPVLNGILVVGRRGGQVIGPRAFFLLCWVSGLVGFVSLVAVMVAVVGRGGHRGGVIWNRVSFKVWGTVDSRYSGFPI